MSAEIQVNTERINRAMESLTEAFNLARPKFERLGWQIAGTANTEYVVSGREAQFYVRAGLSPEYASPEAVQTLVRSILQGKATPVVSLMSPKNRARLAASALRGWASHQSPGPRDPVIWHRHFPDTNVIVTSERAVA